MINGTLRTVEGDATEPQTTTPNEVVVIAHVCNNENKWGAGFVLALNKKWKEPEKVYRSFCERHKKETITLPILGKVCYAKIEHHLVVANMIGQDGTVSKDNPIPIKYKALINCMSEVFAFIEMIKSQTSNPVVIHCPKFGSKLAGGNFEFILELIREIWLEQGIDVVVYEFVPACDKDRKKKPLHKTAITIWTDGDVFKGYPDLATLAREAESGDAYCTKQECVKIEDIETSKDEEVVENFDGLNSFFFGMDEEEEENPGE